ncbi:hypothetical protein GN958_ATG16692 [Phytophthora infestans]|uniref:Uncharacterized protein n=1 Tax=Phytophthora infestans TaxID=4787 RepID=A0A8S9U7D1_PHYIN|nr:hypothetical protein GN958_ATG16692 [Phytophthora infestans]
MKAREFVVSQVRGRLLAREQEENMRLPSSGNMSQSGGNATGSQGGQSTTNAVFQFSTEGNDGPASRHGEPEPPTVSEGIYAATTVCKVWQTRHWYRECWQKDDQNSGNQQKNSGSRGSSRLGGGRHGGRGGGRHGKSGHKSCMANIGGALSMGDPDVMEWCLDSAATGNICNNLSQFTKIATIGDDLEMLCATGNTVSIN